MFFFTPRILLLALIFHLWRIDALYFWCFGCVALASLLLNDFLRRRLTCKPIPERTRGAVFITGGSKGIGRNLVENFAAKGLHVFATVRKEKDLADLKEISPQVFPIIADVTNKDQLLQAQKYVQEELLNQKLNLISLVANAGIMSKENNVDEFDLGKCEHLVDVNCNGVMRTIKFFAPLLDPRGRIFVAGSYWGDFAHKVSFAYSGSKHFLEGYCDCIRKRFYSDKDDRSIILLKIGNISTSMNTKYGEDSPDLVFNAVWDALCSEHPPARAYIGRVGGIPIYWWCLFCRITPTHFYDFLTNMVGSSHSEVAQGGGI